MPIESFPIKPNAILKGRPVKKFFEDVQEAGE